MEKFWAALGTLALVGSIAGYVFERDHFQNLLETSRLLLTGVLVGFLAALLLLFAVRKTLKTWPEKLVLGFLIVLIAPLKTEFLNRKMSEKAGFESFLFESEQARFGSLGVLKNELLQPNQFILSVQKDQKKHVFKHRKHALFPLTKRGEAVLLPIRKGKFGFDFVDFE